MKDKLLSIQEYAKLKKVTRQTVYNWIGEGIIPKEDVVLIPTTIIKIKEYE